MCTALVCYENGFCRFGRTLDIEKSYGESVALLPRHFSLSFLQEGIRKTPFAILGMAHITTVRPCFTMPSTSQVFTSSPCAFPMPSIIPKRRKSTT